MEEENSSTRTGSMAVMLGLVMVGAAVSGVEIKSARMSHHLFCEGTWKQGNSRGKPIIKLNTSVDLESYEAL